MQPSRVGLVLNWRDSLEDDDPVGEVGGHNEIVLHHKSCLFGVQDKPAWQDKLVVTVALVGGASCSLAC